MRVKRQRSFVVKFRCRVRLTRLSNAAQLLFIAVINANDFYSNFAVESLQFFGFRLGLFVILRAPFRHARIRFSLTVRSNLFRFLQLFSSPDQVFLARAIRSNRRLFHVNLIRQLSNT